MTKQEDDEDWYWTHLEMFKQSRADYQAKLKTLSRMELQSLYAFGEEKVADLKTSAFIAHLPETLSEDGIDDIAQWVVAQGRAVYRRVLADATLAPRTLAAPVSAVGDIVIVYYERFREPI